MNLPPQSMRPSPTVLPDSLASSNGPSSRESVANLAHREEVGRLIMGAPTPMCLLRGPQHVHEVANEAYRRLVAPRDVLGMPLREALPELASQGLADQLDHVFTTGETYRAEEKTVRLRGPAGQDEREVFLTFTYQPFHDLQGALDGVLFSALDVTETVLARRTLEELARQAKVEAVHKDQFLAMFAHELRNPLAALSTALQVMAQRAQRDPRALGLQARCERQVATLVRLVDDLLDISRVTTGKVELRREIVDLAVIVQKAFQIARPQMDARRHETSVTVGPGPFWVDGDPTRLEQVFVNLLANATKYTAPGGRISVRLAQEEGADGAQSATVRVCDTGCGIENVKLDTVFDLFMQVDSGLDRSEGGLGIGLTLVRQLVAMHGGEVVAESEGLGKGSTFTVRLPIATAAVEVEPAPVKVGPWRPRGRADRRRVVVVEDNDDARECLQELLRLRGHAVEVASDGIEGRDLIRATHPDVAFVDVGLPGLDGFQLAAQLREAPDLAATWLVAVTGYGSPESRARALEAGFNEHLTKPVTLAQLERVLQISGATHH